MITLPPVPFIYLRHGETAWNAEGRAQGRSDVPLNDRGRAQARDAAATLVGTRVDAIVASPLVRAAETARIVADRLGLAVTTEPHLQEVSFGAQEGAAMGEWYEEWLRGEVTPEAGESFAALRVRADQALRAHLVPGRAVLFVAHGALFRAVRALLGQPIDRRMPNGVPFECTPQNEGWEIKAVPTRPQTV